VPGLDDLLDSEDYTILAPTNAAFAALPNATLELLTNPDNVQFLNATLLNHVLTTVLPTFSFQTGTYITLSGETVNVQISQNNRPIFNIVGTIFEGDIIARNGILHKINAVLLLQGTPSPDTAPPSLEPRVPTNSPVRSPIPTPTPLLQPTVITEAPVTKSPRTVISNNRVRTRNRLREVVMDSRDHFFNE
jgi:Fasciclin domain